VATGQPAFDRIYGASLFDYLATHPADAAIFNASMSSSSPVASGIVLAAYDFPGFSESWMWAEGKARCYMESCRQTPNCKAS